MGLSDTPNGPAYPSRASGWESRLPPLGLPVLRPISLYRHAVAITPVGPQVGSSRSPETCGSGLPHPFAGSAPTLNVSRPAQRSLTLRPACSRSPQGTLSIRGFGSFVTSAAAPIATGWSDRCRVGITPTEDRRLCTAHKGPLLGSQEQFEAEQEAQIGSRLIGRLIKGLIMGGLTEASQGTMSSFKHA
jgi:hypothetical protein